jgi:hypothetical protein
MMKKDKVIFWCATGFIFLFEGIMPALTGHTELAKQGVSHLGFPDYFRVELNILKVIGAIVLILPMIPSRIKEWAFFGLAITSFSAFIGHWVIDGFGSETIFPLILLGILILSYVYYHKVNRAVEV